MRKEQFIVSEEQAGKRLDVCTIENISSLTRSQLKTLKVKASLKGKDLKWSYPVEEGDSIEITWDEPTLDNYQHLEASDVALDVLYEDNDCLVINKPTGMVVHPGIGHSKDTLVNALLSHVENLENEFEGDGLRPGLVHRLDKDTSGLVMCAKNTSSLEFLSQQFRARQTEKYYLALIRGKLKSTRGEIEDSLMRDPRNRQRYKEAPSLEKGKRAFTYWRVLKEWEDSTLVILRPVTGRTHQLRVHMLLQGTPILGDEIYSRTASQYERLFLHAWQLYIRLPHQEKGDLSHFIAPVPEEFLTYFEKQESNYQESPWFNRLISETIDP